MTEDGEGSERSSCVLIVVMVWRAGAGPGAGGEQLQLLEVCGVGKTSQEETLGCFSFLVGNH